MLQKVLLFFKVVPKRSYKCWIHIFIPPVKRPFCTRAKSSNYYRCVVCGHLVLAFFPAGSTSLRLLSSQLGLLRVHVEISVLLVGTTFWSRFVALLVLCPPVWLAWFGNLKLNSLFGWCVNTSLHTKEALTWKVRPVIWIGQQPFQPVLDWLWFPARYTTVTVCFFDW